LIGNTISSIYPNPIWVYAIPLNLFTNKKNAMKKQLLFALFGGISLCLSQNIFGQNGTCIPPIGLDCVTAPKFIDSVYTTNAIMNFSNLGTNCNALDQNYADYPTKIASETAGGNFTVHIGINIVSVAFIGIWIDWNNDLVFGNGELIYLSSGLPSSVDITVNVPPTATVDTLVFRIRSGTTLTGPCDSTDAGETEDYRLIVLNDPSGIVLPLADNTWSFYPNPAGDLLQISFAANSGDAEICLIDVFGNLVISKNYVGEKCEMDLSALPHGMYFLRVNSNGKSGIKKLIH
jgi:GEVED domain/Secretion system C-terminal sorting domain